MVNTVEFVSDATISRVRELNNLMAVGAAAVTFKDNDPYPNPDVDAAIINALQRLIRRKDEMEKLKVYGMSGDDLGAPGHTFYYFATNEQDLINQIINEI